MTFTMIAEDSSWVNSTKDGAGTIVTHTCSAVRRQRSCIVLQLLPGVDKYVSASVPELCTCAAAARTLLMMSSELLQRL